jgi:hypothetical protein
MGVFLPLLLPLLPTLINTVEALFVKSKSGADKMSVVTQQIQALISTLLATKTVTGALQPTDVQVQSVVETVLAGMKGAKTLVTPGQPLIAPSGVPVTGSWYLVRGSIQEITPAPAQ